MAWFEESDQSWRLKNGYQMSVFVGTDGLLFEPGIVYRSGLNQSWKYTHSGDYDLTLTDTSANGLGGDEIVSANGKIYVLSVNDNEIRVLNSSDLGSVTNITVNSPKVKMFTAGGFVWAFEDTLVSQTLYRIDPTTDTKLDITLTHPSLGINIMWDSTTSKVYVDGEYGLVSMNTDGTSQSLVTTTGYCVPHSRDDGHIGLVLGDGTYRVYNTSTLSVGSVLYNVPKLDIQTPTAFTSDGVYISYNGFELGQFNKGSSNGIIINTTQTVTLVSDTRYFYGGFQTGSEFTLDRNPNAVYSGGNLTHINDDVLDEISTNAMTNSWEYMGNAEWVLFRYNQDGIPTYSPEIMVLDKVDSEMLVRPNAISFYSQCSFNGV